MPCVRAFSICSHKANGHKKKGVLRLKHSLLYLSVDVSGGASRRAD